MARAGGETQNLRSPRALPGQNDAMLWHMQVREKEIVLRSYSCPWGTLMSEGGLVKHLGHHSSSTRRRTGKARN